MDCPGLSCTVVGCHGLLWAVMGCGLSWVVGCYGLSWVMVLMTQYELMIIIVGYSFGMMYKNLANCFPSSSA